MYNSNLDDDDDDLRVVSQTAPTSTYTLIRSKSQPFSHRVVAQDREIVDFVDSHTNIKFVFLEIVNLVSNIHKITLGNRKQAFSE